MLLHQGCEGVGFKCIALVQLVFPPMMQRGLPCCNTGMDTHVFQGPELRHKFSSHERWGRCIAIFPNMSKCTRGVGGWGIHQYMMQPRVGNSRLPGAQTQTLASHEGWGCSQKKKRIWASSYPGSCFWAPLYLHMGHESALISAVSSWVYVQQGVNLPKLLLENFFFVKFENKREEKRCLLLVHTNADKGLRQFFLQGWIFTKEP